MNDEELSRKWLVTKKRKETYVPLCSKTNLAVSQNDRIRWGFPKKLQEVLKEEEHG